MKYRELLEKRKNPELNPKQSVNQAIIDRLNKTTDTVGGTTNLFVSFTGIEKLGINPRSEYDTPLGIYAYPAEYIISEVGADKPMASLPFAGDQPWANMFSATGNIINISLRYPSGEVAYLKYIRKLQEMFKYSYDDIEEFKEKALVKEPGGEFWSVMYHICQEKGNGSPMFWNSMCRKIGIDGIVDDGLGVIHRNEPTQAVFFSKSSITNIQRIANKYSPDTVYQSKYKGYDTEVLKRDLTTYFNTASVDDIVKYFDIPGLNQKDKVNLIKDLNKLERVLELDPSLINYVKPHILQKIGWE